MYFYRTGGVLAASFLPKLLPEPAVPGSPSLFLFQRDPQESPAALRVTDTVSSPKEAWMSPGWTRPVVELRLI